MSRAAQESDGEWTSWTRKRLAELSRDVGTSWEDLQNRVREGSSAGVSCYSWRGDEQDARIRKPKAESKLAHQPKVVAVRFDGMCAQYGAVQYGTNIDRNTSHHIPGIECSYLAR